MKRIKIEMFISLTLVFSIILNPLQAFAEDSAKYTNSLFCRLDQTEYTKQGTYGEIGEWTKSGNYYYEILNPEQGKLKEKYISIRRVEMAALDHGVLTIPSEIDGYQVLGVGAFDVVPNPWIPYIRTTGDCRLLEQGELLQKVVFSEGIEVIGIASFKGCMNLKEVIFPDSLVYIAGCAFEDSCRISELSFPQGVVTKAAPFSTLYLKRLTIFSNSPFPVGLSTSPVKKTDVYLRFCEKENYNYWFDGYIKKFYVGSGIKKLRLCFMYDCEVKIGGSIEKLIINDRHTGLDIDGAVGASDVNGVYTVKKAKAVNWAISRVIPYYLKQAGKTRYVKAGKKAGRYRAGWKKIKTTVHKHFFSDSKVRWKTKKTPVKTIYKVYGKKKKSGSYKFIKTTKKRSIRSEYKYIKAVPVKKWD